MENTNERVFFSYAKEDQDRVDDVYQFLSASGIDAWMDIYDLSGGHKWDSKIEEEIEKSAVFLAFLSSNSVTKTGVIQWEFRFALDQQFKRPEGSIFIIPVRLDNCEIPSVFSKYHCIDLQNLQSARTLLESIEEAKRIRSKYATGEISKNDQERTLHPSFIDEPEQNKSKKDFVVVSPSKGMFYRGPSPGSGPYCRKGSTVERGDELFILDVCKVFLVFRAHRSGIVKTFLADNDTYVEENAPLIVFKPL